MSEDRIDRIESKIDKMAEAMVTLVRMEERMVTLFKRMDKYDAIHTGLDERLSEVEKVTIQRGAIGQIVDKGFWLVAGGLVAVVIKRVWAG